MPDLQRPYFLLQHSRKLKMWWHLFWDYSARLLLSIPKLASMSLQVAQFPDIGIYGWNSQDKGGGKDMLTGLRQNLDATYF